MKHMFLLTAIFAAFCSFASKISLVENGAAKVSVVLPDNAIESDRFAAEEFSKWLYAASGVKVELGNGPKPNLIPVRFLHSDKDVKHDGFAVTASEKEIVVSANKPIGILFGVYYILNRWCGVYWCNPDSGVDFERRDSFSIPSGRIVKTPMAVREGVPSGNGALATPARREAVALWNVRNGFNLRSRPRGTDMEKTEAGNYYPNRLMMKLGDEGEASTGGHVLGELVLESPVDPKELAQELEWTKANAKKIFDNGVRQDKISKYARWRVLVKHHPEWFGLVDGKRVPTGVSLRERTEIKGKSSMPCLSNPEVRELLLKNLRLRHDKICKGKPIVFRLCCDDQSQWCECDECMKLLKCKGSCDDKDKASDYWWDFINWMSERLLSDPLVSVNVCVYRTYQAFPKRVKPIARDRMRIILCPHGRCYLHSLTDPKCKSNAKYKAMFDEWAREGMPILAFEYTNQTPGKCNYAFWERAWVQDLKWYAKHGISQGAGGLIGPWDAYSTDDGYFRRNATKARWQIGWLTGHFEWDSEDDFDDVRNRLFKIYYRKAAAKMIEYRALLEKAIYATGQCMCYGSGGTLFSSAAFQPGVLAKAKSLLDESMALASGDTELQRRIAADAEWFRTNWEAAGISGDSAIEMTRTSCAPAIDGRLDESFWRTASPVDDFRKIVVIRDTPRKPEERYSPATTLKFAFDDKNLYIGCVCDKAGGKVNDIPAQGNVFDAMKGSHMEFFFLSPSLGGKYYHIAISHNGKKYSAFTENGKSRDLKRQLPFVHAITDSPTEWTLEISVPLDALGGAKPGDLWKIDASRIAVDQKGKPIRGYGSLCGFGMHSSEYWKTFSFGAPSNLISNGSFEELGAPPAKKEGDKGLNGRGWTFVSDEVPSRWFYQQNGGFAESVEGPSPEGKRFLRLKSPKRGRDCFIWQDIQAYPGGTGKISFSFKARGKGRVTARLMQHPKQTEKIVVKVDASEWKEYCGVFELADLHPSRFMLNVGSDGLDIDDLVLSINDKSEKSTCNPSAASKKPLKVLMIGNSFSICVLREMPKICEDLNLPLDLCSLYIGGCPLSRHASNLSSNQVNYRISWNYCGQTDIHAVPFSKVLNERTDSGAGSILRKMLAADKWDVVTIQQASHESWKKESYEPYGTEIIEAICKHAPQAKIYVQQTWSYTPLAPRLRTWGLTYETMFAKLSAAYKSFAESHNLETIRTGEAINRYRKELPIVFRPNLPSNEDLVGTIIQCKKDARGDLVVKGDTIHLNPKGEFLQGLVWASKLFDVDVTASRYVPASMVSCPREVALMRKIASELR